jgi:hypothetical protein
MAGSAWHRQMAFWRFIANPKVTVEKLIEGWSLQTRSAVEGRHVLAIQDSSDIKFSTTARSRRGLGKVGKGNIFGLVLHAMMGVDADSGSCLGLIGGKIWTRKGKAKLSHAQRPLAEKESERWISTWQKAVKDVLAKARTVTVINDREGAFYTHWARVREAGLHLLSRVMHDHAVERGGTLRKFVKKTAFCAQIVIDLPKRMDHAGRKAHLSLRFGKVEIKRPKNTIEKDLPETVALFFVEAIELHPSKGAKPIHWLLLTTHEVQSLEHALRIVSWYKLRWIIEQFFRSMKSQGLRIEESQLETAEGLMKLTAIAARAATIVIQLVQARRGGEELPAEFVFSPDEIEVLDAINKDIQGKTELQKNPNRPKTIPWAAWIIARLGGWTGYASHRPPGPITIHHGLDVFQKTCFGWNLKNV